MAVFSCVIKAKRDYQNYLFILLATHFIPRKGSDMETEFSKKSTFLKMNPVEQRKRLLYGFMLSSEKTTEAARTF